MAIMCISCVYMGLHLWMRNKSKVCIRYSKNVRTHAYKWNTHGRPDNNLDVFGIPKNPYFNPSHASITSEMKILHISKWPLPQKCTSRTFSMSFLAWKEKEPKNIYIGIVINWNHSEKANLKHKSRFFQGGALNAPPYRHRIKV